ncbi:hypothetical protein ACRAWC_16220 [Leifsonia sp. L25]|uniref:hypothetical protein n=1 Tax=Actinomycetes TaxID=1760 RepID=UPI003D694467
MSARRPAHPGAFLELAAVTVAWAVMLFALAWGALMIVSTMFASQIHAILAIFGIAPN